MDRKILNEVILVCQNKVKCIALDMSGVGNKLCKVVLEDQVTEQVRMQGGTSEGRPVNVRKVEITKNDDITIARQLSS